MKMLSNRTVLTVLRNKDLWAIECEGDHFGHAPDKEVVKATANKRARQMLDKGEPCQVRVLGENGYFGG